jgi:hypothetical protein
VKPCKFTARIEAAYGGGACVAFPFDVEKEFGAKGRVAVKATFDGVSYTGSLMKCGPGQHMLGILKAIQGQIGKGVGDSIEVVVWRDDAERTVEIPAEFNALLKEQGLLQDFEALSYTHRKEYCRWITEAKREETRSARLAKSIVMLRKGIKTPG